MPRLPGNICRELNSAPALLPKCGLRLRVSLWPINLQRARLVNLTVSERQELSSDSLTLEVFSRLDKLEAPIWRFVVPQKGDR